MPRPEELEKRRNKNHDELEEKLKKLYSPQQWPEFSKNEEKDGDRWLCFTII